MCHRSLLENIKAQEAAKKENAKKTLRAKREFQDLIKKMKIYESTKFPMHPKMEKLLALILQHFSDGESVKKCGNTKIMVFTTYRDCVEDIVETLAEHKPMIRPMKFIGQGTDKQGRKGLKQREQLAVSRRLYRSLVTEDIRLSRNSRTVNSMSSSQPQLVRRASTSARLTSSSVMMLRRRQFAWFAEFISMPLVLTHPT